MSTDLKQREVALGGRLAAYGWRETDGPLSTPCWIVGKSPKRDGYVAFSFNRTYWLAHRAAYTAWVGEIPAGKLIRHQCDTRPCINPDHLLPGTHKDNHDDMVTRGRRGSPAKRKLSEDQVRDVRKLRAEGLTLREIGDAFGVTESNVHYICSRKSWREVS